MSDVEDVPLTIAVTDKEGGEWIPFGQFKGATVHSIRFAGGYEWDCKNGWRTKVIARG